MESNVTIDDITSLLKYIGYIAGVYVFLQRTHSSQQTRLVKSISETVSSINKLCLEELLYEDSEKSNVIKRRIAKKYVKDNVRYKIYMHLNDLENLLINFEYLGPVYSFISIFTNQVTLKSKNNALEKFNDYKTKILFNSPFENKSIAIDRGNAHHKIIEIWQSSMILINELEMHLKKYF